MQKIWLKLRWLAVNFRILNHIDRRLSLDVCECVFCQLNRFAPIKCQCEWNPTDWLMPRYCMAVKTLHTQLMYIQKPKMSINLEFICALIRSEMIFVLFRANEADERWNIIKFKIKWPQTVRICHRTTYWLTRINADGRSASQNWLPLIVNNIAWTRLITGRCFASSMLQNLHWIQMKSSNWLND